MAYETLLVEKQPGVGIITLNRPEKLNALSLVLSTELEQALTQFEQDDEVKAIIITGAGEKAFSAGADIHEISEQSEAQLKERGSRGLERSWHIATCKKPTIGAINGLAYGGGALMASYFDIRVGCERTSFRFLGASYGRTNSTWTLPLIVGWSVTKELLLTARVVKAEEAFRIGLLNRLVNSSELMKTAIEVGETIAANDTRIVQGIKDILVRDIGMGWKEMQLNESQTVAQKLQAPPPKESFKQFLERNPR